MKKTLKQNGESPKIDLDKALIHWQDLSERCLLPYCVAGQIARDMKDEKKISGNMLLLATQRKYLTHEVLSTLRVLVPKHVMDEKSITMTLDGVLVVVEIKENDDKFFSNPDFKFYWSWEYQIPNPFDEYWNIWNK